MASILVDKWPENKEEIYDYKQWVPKEWTIGEPITKEKLQNLDDGIAVLATQMKAILGEFNPTSLDSAQLNASRLDNIQEWITGSTGGSYNIGGSGSDIASRLNGIDEIRGWIASDSGYQSSISINDRLCTIESSIDNIENQTIANIETKNNEQDERLGSIETLNNTQNDQIENLENRADDINNAIIDQNNELNTIKYWISGGSDGTPIDNRLQSLENSCTTLQTDNNTNKTNISNIITEIGGTYDESSGFTDSRINAIETLNTTQDNRLTNLEQKVGDGAGISPYTNLTEAVINIMEIEGFDRVSIFKQNVNNILAEIWGEGKTLDNINFIEDVSRIDELDSTVNNENGLSKQVQTLATKQNTLEQNLAATNEKIPIEMYEAINPSASDTIELDATPRDKSIFFIAIPQGTLGIDNLKLETNDITFRDTNSTTVTVKKNFSESLIAKYPPNSLISIYRNGANAYAYNVPMIL